MVSQKQKLLAAGAVLAVGLGAALLFRRTERDAAVAPSTPAERTVMALPATMPTAPVLIDQSLDGQFSPLAALPATSAGLVSTTDDALRALPDAALGENDLADPASQPAATLPATESAASTGGRPVYSPIDASDSDSDAASPYRIHVVHEGDSLERLAQRYLDDGGRSLELFDLNRDVLDNPHLLPIGAELRIPITPPDAGK